jgi:long-chain acyl-CoA synthetase
VSRLQEQQRYHQLYQKALVNSKVMFAGMLLQRAARLYPKRIALICGKNTITFEQLYYRALSLTKKLIAQGVKPRDHVCLLFENSIEFYIGYYGIWQAGAVVAPLNTFLHERELTYIIADAQAQAIVVSKKLSESVKNLVSIVFTEDDMHDVSSQDVDYTIPNLEPHELAALLYTSGTTGMPKGVMLSSTNILVGMIQAAARLKVTENVRAFGVLPLFHSFAQVTCVWGAFFVGATIVIIPRIERHAIQEGLQHKPTVFLGVPGLFGVLCLFKNINLESIDFFVCGGDSLPDKIRSAFELVYRRKLCNGYGLTESSPVISVELDDILLPTNCIGRPVIGVEVSIRDEQGNQLKQGEIGILWVKGPNIMLGYHNAPELTHQMIRDGWLDTGDFAQQDAEGRLYIVGRFKDLIVNKGLKIYPPEVENVILMHPGVMAVGLIGFPDPDGEIPVAFVALRYEVPQIEKELRELCLQNLAPYKVPRKFIFLPSLPMTATGKVDKKILKADYIHNQKK